MEQAQKKFMFACGQTTTSVNFRQIELYRELIREELVKELFPALDTWLNSPLSIENTEHLLKEIGDVLVVVHGLAYSMGTDPLAIKDQVDASNLSKIPPDHSQVLKREDGKILKPVSYREADMRDLAVSVFKKLGGMVYE